MNTPSPLEEITQLPVSQLGERCAGETQRFFQGRGSDDRWCFELLRRAVCESEEAAWSLVVQTYRPQVAAWVTGCRGYRAEWDAVDDFVQEAFRRFIAALTPEKFGRFPNLKQLLAYLKSCVFGAVTDEARKAQRRQLIQISDNLTDQARVVPALLDAEMARSFWKIIQERLNSEQERILVEEMFVYGKRPRHLAEQFPNLFDSAAQVSRIKRNLLDRLQRDPTVARIWEDWQS